MDIYRCHNHARYSITGVPMIPNSLAGIIGFLIFVVLVLSMSAGDLFPDQTKGISDTQNRFNVNLNSTINSSVTPATDVWSSIANVFDTITGFFGVIITFIEMIFQYFFFFIGISLLLPPEFYVFFAILSSGLIIAIIKLIFLSGD